MRFVLGVPTKVDGRMRTSYLPAAGRWLVSMVVQRTDPREARDAKSRSRFAANPPTSATTL
jgi:hypothetical protein